jgi:hypothetical protein
MQVEFELGHGPMIFWQSYSSWGNFQFPLSNFCLDVCTRLKLHVYIRHRNAQFKFEFGYGPTIFDRVVPLELRKKCEIFSFRSLSLQQLHTFNLNLIYGYIIVLCQVRIWSWSNDFWQNYPSWRNFWFPLSIFCLDVCIRLKLHVYIRHRNAQVRFNLVMVQWFLIELSLLNLK